MNPNDVNIMLLETVAQHLGAELLERMVFVGGAVAGLLITDPAMPSIRPTEDVDLVVHLTGATGCGKTWLACALGHQACRQERWPGKTEQGYK